ncbi:MAG: flagellin [Thalassotalea sp.]
MEISPHQISTSANNIERLEQKRAAEDEKIATGKRINRAADDTAGLQISERLTAQINNDAQLSNNNQDQVNNNQVQAGQLAAINDGLQRANTLSAQSGNPLADQDAIQAEFNQITEQINTLAEEALGSEDFISGLDAFDTETTQAALEAAFSQVADTATNLGAQANSLPSQTATYQTSVVNVSAARSSIQDTNIAETTSNQQQTAVLLESAVISKKDEEARKGLLVNQLV